MHVQLPIMEKMRRVCVEKIGGWISTDSNIGGVKTYIGLILNALREI